MQVSGYNLAMHNESGYDSKVELQLIQPKYKHFRYYPIISCDRNKLLL